MDDAVASERLLGEPSSATMGDSRATSSTAPAQRRVFVAGGLAAADPTASEAGLPGSCSKAGEYSRRFTEIHRVAYEWQIPDFSFHWESLHQGGDLSSPPFGKRQEWSLSLARRLSPDGRTERVSCWVRYLRSKWILPTSLQLNDVSLHALENCLDPWGGLCGVQRLCDADQLPPEGDALVIKCEIVWIELEAKEDWYPQEDLNLAPQSAIRNLATGPTMQQDFAKFLANTLASEPDVEFCCANGEILSAHRSVLRARSPVFSAMLERGRFLEGTLGTKVPLPDVDSEVGAALLGFIYSDEISPPADINQAFELLRVADLYAFDGLKLLASEWLEGQTDSANAIDMLVKASLFHTEVLKATAMDVVLANFDDLDSKGELDKLDSHPQIMKEIMRSIARSGPQGQNAPSMTPFGCKGHSRRVAPDHYRSDFRRGAGAPVRLLTEI